MNHLPRSREGHTFEPGQCRHATHAGRRFAHRVGHHPRDLARPASAEPTARLPSHAERQELGREGEKQAIRADERRQAAVRTEQPDADDMDRLPDPGAAGSSDPAGSAESRHRGPDLQPRTRGTWADTGSGPAEAPDWTTFDIGRAVKSSEGMHTSSGKIKPAYTSFEMVACTVGHYDPDTPKSRITETGMRPYSRNSKHLYQLPSME